MKKQTKHDDTIVESLFFFRYKFENYQSLYIIVLIKHINM